MRLLRLRAAVYSITVQAWESSVVTHLIDAHAHTASSKLHRPQRLTALSHNSCVCSHFVPYHHHHLLHKRLENPRIPFQSQLHFDSRNATSLSFANPGRPLGRSPLPHGHLRRNRLTSLLHFHISWHRPIGCLVLCRHRHTLIPHLTTLGPPTHHPTTTHPFTATSARRPAQCQCTRTRIIQMLRTFVSTCATYQELRARRRARPQNCRSSTCLTSKP